MVNSRAELLVQDPADGTYFLDDFMLFSQFNPDTDRIKKSNLFGRVVVRGDRRPPLAGQEIHVRGTLTDYWFKKDPEVGEILYVEFIGGQQIPREFRKPFSLSHRREEATKLARFYQKTLEPMKFQEIIFGAKKNKMHYFIEGIQTPDAKSWVLF